MVFPSGKVWGVVDIVVYVYFATPPDSCYWTFYVTLVIINIPVMPLALLCNFACVICLLFVFVGRVFFFGGFRCVYIYVFGRVLTF